MPNRNQPYLPLYIQDFLTDEKLIECSASSTGVYIRIMCIMHKSEEYGKILLKEKDKQNKNICLDFAYKIAKHLPYKLEEVEECLIELVGNNVLSIEGDYLIQKRMVKDNEISELRSKSGRKGGLKTMSIKNDFDKPSAQANAQAKTEANSENENEINSINNNEEKKVEIPIDSVCYNVEEYLLANQIKFEAICIKTNKTLVEAKNELMKCHLHLEKHEKYPMAKKAALAWVTSWMINAKDFNAKYLPSQAEKKSTEAPKKNIDELVKKYQN
jgi:uncharacterized protein YdaU (DUF1376 family)